MKEKTANEMFEELGYEKQVVYYNYEIDETIYERNFEYSTNVIFRHKNKTFKAYYGRNCKGANIDMEILQAINKKCQELGWLK